MEWDQQWAEAQNTDPASRQDMFLFIWWPDYADPVSWFTSLLHSEDEIVYNLSYVQDEALDALIDEAVELTVTDRDAAEADYVKAVHVFAEGNPQPGVVSYQFTPACGKASAATRMRLAQTQDIICVAEMSNGALHTAKANIKVTIGGCGG